LTDVARLGIAIDSSQTISAKKALDDLVVSGKAASVAAADFQKKTAAASSGAVAWQKSTAAAAAGARGLSFDAKNLAFQLVDVGQGVLSGQRAFQIFAQQAGQIGQIIATSPKGLGGLLKELGGSFVGMLTPARLAGAGVVATGVAAATALASWKSYTLQLDDSARAAGTTARSLSTLQAAASFKGIDVTEFAKGTDQFARSIYDAKNNAGGLADVFKANNLVVGDFEQTLAKAANLIQNAKNDQQRLVLLQQMGLPATMQWVRLLSGGADGLKASRDAAYDFGAAADQDMIKKAREFDEAWNKTTTNFALGWRSAAINAGGYIKSLIDLIPKADPLQLRLTPGMKNAFFADAVARGNGTTLKSDSDVSSSYSFMSGKKQDWLSNGSVVDPASIRNSNALYQQYVGMLGQTASIKQLELSLDKQIQTYNLTPGAIALTKQQVDTLHRLTVEQALGITQIKVQTDAYKVQGATIGMSIGDATAYSARLNAINDARRAGRTLTPDNIAQIQREAAALGDAARQADLLNFAYTGLVQGPLQTFTSAIAQGSNAWDAFKKAGQSALNAIASKLADMAAQNLWKAALGGSSGGIGGILGSLFGGATGSGIGSVGVVGAAGGMAVPTFFADGGYTGPGGKYQPAGVVHKGEYVIDAANTARIGVHNLDRLRGYAEGGIVDGLSGFNVRGSAANDNRSSGSLGRMPQTLNINVNVTGARGNQEIADMVQQGVAAGLDGFVTSPQFPEHIALANKKVGSRRLG
jgi:hypothetical protein